MELINKTVKFNVSVLRQNLLRQRITRERFKFPLTQEQAEDVLTAAYQAEIDFRHRTFDDDEPTRENIKRVAKFLTDDNQKFGMIFLGLCGNGKTTMLYAFQQSVNYLNRNNVFADSSQVGIQIMDAKEIAGIAKDVKEFRTIKNRPMLAIEDMGREPTEVLDYGNVLNPVIDLIEYRYDAQLFTIITTNLNPEEIRAKYGARVADRFNEMLEKIVFKNKSYRK
jgi:DNA replication protein DnaC